MELHQVFTDTDPRARNSVFGVVAIMGDGTFNFVELNLEAQGRRTTEVMVALCEDLLNPPPDQVHPYQLRRDDWFDAYATDIMRTTPFRAFETAILAISPSTYPNVDEYRGKWALSFYPTVSCAVV